MNAKHIQLTDINQLPNDVLERILIYLSGKYLLKNATLVCKLWSNIIENESFWIQKALFDGRFNRKNIEYFHKNNLNCIKQLYFTSHKNLIKNPYGEEGFTKWCYVQLNWDRTDLDDFLNICNAESSNPWLYYKEHCNKDDFDMNTEISGFRIQDDHGEPFIVNNTHMKNFLTTYFLCTKFQVIDLRKEGFTSDLLNKVKPKIEVSDNYAARWDCGSQYRIFVGLLNENFEQIDYVDFDDVIPQWNDQEWHNWTHIFDSYSNDLRYIVVLHEGKDTQYWAGHYGIKITGTSVKVIL